MTKAAALTEWEFEDFHREQQSCVTGDSDGGICSAGRPREFGTNEFVTQQKCLKSILCQSSKTKNLQNDFQADSRRFFRPSQNNNFADFRAFIVRQVSFMGLERLMQFAMLYMTEHELEQAQHEAVVAHQKYEQSRKTASGHIRVATQNYAAAVFSSRVVENGASGNFSTRKKHWCPC